MQFQPARKHHMPATCDATAEPPLTKPRIDSSTAQSPAVAVVASAPASVIIGYEASSSSSSLEAGQAHVMDPAASLDSRSRAISTEESWHINTQPLSMSTVSTSSTVAHKQPPRLCVACCVIMKVRV